MKHTHPYILLILLFTILSCKNKQIEAKTPTIALSNYNADELLERVKVLSSDEFEGRRTGTNGAKKARNYIIEQFKKLDTKPFGNYQHDFKFRRGNDSISAVNILAKIDGKTYPEKYIVVSAHYDHLGKKNGKIFNGADDDASGVSALVALGEILKKNPPKHSVILAAFDAEEMGLQGAKYFVDNTEGNNIVLNLNLDMISRSSKNELYVVGSRYTDFLKTAISNFKNPTETKLIVGHDGTDGKMDWTYSSDHAPFHKARIPFLYFGNEDHRDYHKPGDDFSKITPEFYQNAVTIILSLFQDLDALKL